MKRRLRIPRRRALLTAGAPIAALVALFLFLAGTTAGARFVVARALGRAPVGVTVSIGHIDGKLLGPLGLRDIRVGNQLVEVGIDSVGLDWSPRRLFKRQFWIERVAIDGVDARLLPPPPGGYPPKPAGDAAKPPPEMPLEIIITEARASNVKLLVTESVEFRDLRLSLRGRADRYELDLATRLVGEDTPEIGVTAAATGTLKDISLVPLEVRTLGGVARVRANLVWYPAITWTARASIDSLQPGLLLKDPALLPGRLGARLRSEGRVAAALPSGWASLDTLSGELLERTVTGAARAEWTGLSEAKITANAAWGPVVAALTAAITDSLEAHLTADCADLSGAAPGLGGRGALEARLSGLRTAPALTATVRLEELSRAEPPLTIADVAGALDLRLAGLDTIAATKPTGEGRLRLRADTIRFGQALLDSAVVTAAGTHLAQRARVTVDGEPLRACLALGGGFDAADSAWSGAVDTLSLANLYAGAWSLCEAAAVHVGSRSAVLDSLCLVQQAGAADADGAPAYGAGATLRLGGTWAAGVAPGGSWSAWADLAGLPLAMANAYLPEGQRLSGTAGAALAADGEATKLRGAASASLNDTWFLFEANGKSDSLQVETATLTGAAGPRDVSAKLAASVFSPRSGGRAQMAGELTLPGGALLPIVPDSQAVRATLSGGVSDLAFIDGLSPLITESRGQVELEAQVAGTLSAPVVTGELRVRDMATTLPDLGITISDVQLTASGDVAEGYALDGSARSGEGTLAVSGRIPPRLTSTTPLTVTLRGERFQAVDTPEVQVQITPNLELVCDGKRLDVRGTVDLPVVEVEMVEMPETAVPPTRDAIIVDAKAPSGPPAIDTWVDMKVSLGDQVRFRGFAMGIGLAGALEVKQHVPELPDCRGDLRVNDGYYRAYGQNLDLESGVISFVGPVDDPALNIKARRETPDGVKVGVIVTGSALVPQLKVWSDPVMAETQALSYLLTGRPLDAGNGDDKARVAATAALMGSNVLSSQLGRKVGLDEARVETGGSLDQAALVTGKYLTPELYLSYAMGLFDRSNLVRLRYIMSPKWSVQTETGTTMGADLMYKIERGGKR